MTRELRCESLGRGFAWLDTGTHESLLHAAKFIEAIESRQGLRIVGLEEVALVKVFLCAAPLQGTAERMKNEYGRYLLERLAEIRRTG